MSLAATVLQLAGLTLEIFGVLLMANGYTRGVEDAGTIRLLVQALWRGRVVREATRMRRLTRENEVVVLQGLAFIAFGFVLQLLGLLGSLW